MVRAVLLAVIFTIAPAASAETVSGVARAIDGDSLVVGQQEVRLHGIDAPEFTQSCLREQRRWACGAAAADQLSMLVAGGGVDCTVLGKDTHNRLLASCSVRGLDLNRAMVAAGYALAYRRFSTVYVGVEERAKAAKRGIWAGSFELPSEIRHAGEDYRIEHRPVERQAGDRPVISSFASKMAPSGNCRIKGNHSRKGERIYHLPGMPYYAETVAEEFFCTESQARAAGYRRSKADRHR